jgi:hypothetical protein
MGTWLSTKNVIPIYLEYIGSSEHYLAPSQALAIELELPPTTPLDECLRKLKSLNLYALIIADEIEQVYTGTDFPKKRRLILDDLAELGSQRSGRTYTYICGSSSLVPALISKNAVHSEELRNEFPFVSSAPILNGKKFAGLRVHRGLHGKEDIRILQKSYKVDDETANLLYYLCGSNLRSIDKVVEKIRSFPISKRSKWRYS